MTDSSKKVTRYLFADLVLDIQRGELTRDANHISLPKLSYDLLVALVESSPALLSQQKLMEQVWPNRVIGDETLKQRIKLLRKALGDDASAPRYIEAVRGRGYRLLPQVDRECVVRQPPSVMLDLAANDLFPNLQANQFKGLWQLVSRGGILLLLVLLTLFALMTTFNSDSPESLAPHRIAILPFEHNLPAEQMHLLAGINDSLYQQLSQLDSIRLVSPSVVNDFASKDSELITLARHFDAGLVIEGSLSVLEDNVKLGISLTDTNEQALRWSREYTSSLREMAKLKQEVSLALARQIANQPGSVLPAEKTVNPIAHKFYLRGKEYYQRYHKRDNAIAIDFFNKAIAEYPQYALAYAALSQAYSQELFQFGGGEQEKQRAIDNAYLAITHDNQLAAAYQSLGTAYYVSGWLSKSISAHQKALALSQEKVETLTNLAFIYSEQGKLAQALTWHKNALSLKADHVVAMVHAGISLQRLGEYKLAEAWYKNALALQPDYFLASYHLGTLYRVQGEYEQALAFFHTLLKQEIENPLIIEGLADTYLYAGQIEQAKALYDKLLASPGAKNDSRVKTLALLLSSAIDEQAVSSLVEHHRRLLSEGSDKPEHSFLLALLYIQQGQVENATRYLVQAVEQGMVLLPQHLTSVLMKPLSKDTRYQTLMNRLVSPGSRELPQDNTLDFFRP